MERKQALDLGRYGIVWPQSVGGGTYNAVAAAVYRARSRRRFMTGGCAGEDREPPCALGLKQQDTRRPILGAQSEGRDFRHYHDRERRNSDSPI